MRFEGCRIHHDTLFSQRRTISLGPSLGGRLPAEAVVWAGIGLGFVCLLGMFPVAWQVASEGRHRKRDLIVTVGLLVLAGGQTTF